jgi:hypothetical protein
MAALFTPREVLIPMVAGSAAGAIARISADGELADPHAAQLDRGLAALLECGLYKAGQQSKAASRLVRLGRRGFLQHASEALHVDNPGDIVGLGAENSSSAELGLALALLMYRSQTELRSVLATGALDLSHGDRSVPVLPIHHLGQKLRTVVRHFEQPGAANAPGMLLAPEKDPDGVPIMDRYQREVGELAGVGVEVHGARSLSDAAQLVGARKPAVSRLEQNIKRGLVASAACLAGAAALHSWYVSPIALSFATVANPDGSISATPTRLGAVGSGMGILPPCHVAGSDTPAFVIGEQLAMSLKTGKAHDLSTLFGGYHLVLVSVSSMSGEKSLLPPGKGSVIPGSEMPFRTGVREPAEETLLVWLAKRGGAFDTNALDVKLHGVIDRLKPAERISGARNFLSHLAPGFLSYTFRSVAPESCP